MEKLVVILFLRVENIGCSNKSATFNFVRKCTIYSKNADIFISVKSTHTAINCGTQYPTNVPHDSAGTPFDEILDDISAQLRFNFANDTSNLRLELRNFLWFVGIDTRFHKTPKERSRTVSNRTTSVANSDRHCVI
jgi:hypothetical protein